MLKIQLICVGNKMPGWVDTAVQIFEKRLREFCQFSIIEIAPQKRNKSKAVDVILQKESQFILNSIPSQSLCILLDSGGREFDSQQLARRISNLQLSHSHWSIIIGGPEGHGHEIQKRANEQWSLSRLTFAHPLARVIVCESLYRSFAILNNHPYHK